MSNRSVIPFGPQHPVLPEPIHLDLVIEDEKVIEAIPSFGFIHRGLERLVEKKDFMEYSFVAERICGICSFTHGMGYCQTVERCMGLAIPERATVLRTFWSELTRIHSHLLWAGLGADAFGFENLFMACWRLREKILDMMEEMTGGRVIFSVCKVGGLRRDASNDTLKRCLAELKGLSGEIGEIADVFINDYTVKKRLVGVGVLSPEDAHATGAVGPTLRASGVASDTRLDKYASYDKLRFEPITDKGCDCHSRVVVRLKEVYQSLDLMEQLLAIIPDGPVDMKVTANPTGEYFGRLEQPRGEVIYYVKGNGTKNLERFRVRTPTFANIPPLLKILQGCQLADVPNIVLTIDPCISCTER